MLYITSAFAAALPPRSKLPRSPAPWRCCLRPASPLHTRRSLACALSRADRDSHSRPILPRFRIPAYSRRSQTPPVSSAPAPKPFLCPLAPTPHVFEIFEADLFSCLASPHSRFAPKSEGESDFLAASANTSNPG